MKAKLKQGNEKMSQGLFKVNPTSWILKADHVPYPLPTDSKRWHRWYEIGYRCLSSKEHVIVIAQFLKKPAITYAWMKQTYI